jgi:3-oxoadipate enol-lactonase
VTVLHSEVTGPATAPVLVLGPSLGTALGVFDAQVAALSDDWRIVRFDLPGHGGSAAPAGRCTVPGIAVDVLALLDDLGVGRFHYAGVSLGGAVGQQLALDRGERLLSLTVCASSARFADPPSWTSRTATVRAEGTEALVASRTGTWWTAEFAERAPQEVERLLGMLRATSP